MPQTRCLICQNLIPPANPSAWFCSPACLEQSVRLESAFVRLVYKNQWSPAQFKMLLDEPYARELARRVVWRQGEHEFMVCEDYTFATVNQRELHLQAELPIEALTQLSPPWQEVFWDYAQIPLSFRQQEREILTQITQRGFLLPAIQHSQVEIRRSVARNPALPADLLTILAQDLHPLVRVGVALNPHTPPALLEQLAQDSANVVCEAVAQHPHLPDQLLAQLLLHPHMLVRSVAAIHSGRLALLQRIATVLEVLHTTQLPLAALEKCLHQQLPVLRMALAQHAALASQVVALLTRDPDHKVKAAASANLQQRRGA